MLKTLQELNLRKIIDGIVEYVLEYKQLSLILLGIFLVIRAYLFLKKNKNRLYIPLMSYKRRRKFKRRFWFAFCLFYCWIFELILHPDYFALWEEIIWW